MSTDSDATSLATPAFFFYSSDNLLVPFSPASSVRGCFVRSRPTSTDIYEPEPRGSLYKGFAVEETPPDDSCASTPTMDVNDAIERVPITIEDPASSHQNISGDSRSIALSTFTTTSRRVRLVRRCDAETNAELLKENKDLHTKSVADSLSSRRHTWSSYKAIRKTVSNVLHRKEPIHVATAVKAEAIPSKRPLGRLKSSSASLFTRRRGATISTDGRTVPRLSFAKRALSSRSGAATKALQPRAQLRRSRSFSDFIYAPSPSDDAGDDDDELAEATAEARGVAERIGRCWMFEEVPEDEKNIAPLGQALLEGRVG